MTVTRRIRRRGEHEISRKPLRAGMPGDFRWTCGDYARVFVFITHEAAGALATRHSPRPLLGERFMHNSAASRREIAESYLNLEAVIARSEATKQSIALAVDCFAEPVIGRAFARPVGSQ
jgi:hypothetical protein